MIRKVRKVKNESKKELVAPKFVDNINEEISDYNELSQVLDLKNQRLDILFKKQKKFLSKGYNLADFKEPVLQLIRRDMSVEFYENVKPGTYVIKHSDKNIDTVEINLPEGKILRFPYGPKSFRGYIHHEDEFVPYPQDLLLNAEMVRIMIDKTLNDVKKWKAEEIRARGDVWIKIAMAVALVIGAYAVYRMVIPDPVVQKVVDNALNNVPNVVSNVTRNITQIIVDGGAQG